MAMFNASSQRDFASSTTSSNIKEASTEARILTATPPYTEFSPSRRKFIIFLVTGTAFCAPLAGNIYLPVLPTLANEFHVSTGAINATISVFMFAFAVFPLFWGASADSYGRKPLYTIALALFVLSNMLVAVLPANFGALIVLRVMQALGASAGVSLGAGTIADIIEPKSRATAISIFMIGPQIGPILGPLLGGLIVQYSTWRWIFAFLAIYGFFIWVALLFLLPETLQSKVGNHSAYTGHAWVQLPRFKVKNEVAATQKAPSVFRRLAIISRSFPVMLACINTGILFGAYYALAVPLPKLFEEKYGLDSHVVGLIFLAPGFAMVVGSLLSGRYSDWSRARAVSASSDGFVAPENRIKPQIFGVCVFPMGILIYGWSVHYTLHLVVPILGAFLVAFSMAWVFTSNTAYLTECKPGSAATIVALASLFRNPSAGIASAVIDPLLEKMGIGWCYTGLAFFTCTSVAIVLAFHSFGSSWRADERRKEENMQTQSAGKQSV